MCFTHIGVFYNYQTSLKDSKTVNQTELGRERLYYVHNTKLLNSKRQELVDCELTDCDDSVKERIGIIEPTAMFEKKTGLCVMSSLSQIDALGKTNWNKFDADKNENISPNLNS